ncbi:DUF4258 domain-containing protein [Candidatus Desantisbacteria bacterium]|nr:DUF4258 domain-containing protein [Candidatus Desantisbacteria bacterium]
MSQERFGIKSKIVVLNGVVYTINVQWHEIHIKFTHHSLERINVWELETKSVIEALLFPEEVVIGHGGRFIAHLCDNGHIIRVIYEYEGLLAVVVPVYYPYAFRYFQGGGSYANKIFT